MILLIRPLILTLPILLIRHRKTRLIRRPQRRCRPCRTDGTGGAMSEALPFLQESNCIRISFGTILVIEVEFCLNPRILRAVLFYLALNLEKSDGD